MKGAPKAVDPQQLAQQQQQSNFDTARQQALMNLVSTYSPWGSSVYKPQPGGGFRLDQMLSPQLQQLFGGQLNLAGLLTGAGTGMLGGAGAMADYGRNLLLGRGAQAAAGIPLNLDLSKVPLPANLTTGMFRTNVAGGPIQSSVNANFPALTKAAEDAAYNVQARYLDPQFAQKERDVRQRLADRGITDIDRVTGAENPAYTRAIGDLERTSQQAYEGARNLATTAGQEEQARLFGQSLQAGGFANAAEAQKFNQDLTRANLWNQALLSATGQGNTAAQLGLQRAQAGAMQPAAALDALRGYGSTVYGTGLGTLGQVSPFASLAPEWPNQIPTQAFSPTRIEPTNFAAITDAATKQNALANQSLFQNLGGFGTLLGLGSMGTGLFGGGGLLGTGLLTGMFGGGGGGGGGGDFGGGRTAF